MRVLQHIGHTRLDPGDRHLAGGKALDPEVVVRTELQAQPILQQALDAAELQALLAHQEAVEAGGEVGQVKAPPIPGLDVKADRVVRTTGR